MIKGQRVGTYKWSVADTAFKLMRKGIIDRKTLAKELCLRRYEVKHFLRWHVKCGFIQYNVESDTFSFVEK